MTDTELANALFDAWRRAADEPNGIEVWQIVAKKARELLAAPEPLPTDADVRRRIENAMHEMTKVDVAALVDSHAERLNEIERAAKAEAKSVLSIQLDFDARLKKLESQASEASCTVENEINDTLKAHRQWLGSLGERIEYAERLFRNIGAAFDKT